MASFSQFGNDLHTGKRSFNRRRASANWPRAIKASACPQSAMPEYQSLPKAGTLAKTARALSHWLAASKATPASKSASGVHQPASA